MHCMHHSPPIGTMYNTPISRRMLDESQVLLLLSVMEEADGLHAGN